MKSTCGLYNKVGHYESVCKAKCTQKNKEAKGKGTHQSHSQERSSTPGSSKKPTVSTNSLALKTTDQLKQDFPKIIFHCIRTVPNAYINYTNMPNQDLEETEVKTSLVTEMDIDWHGKTYVTAYLDVQLHCRNNRDSIWAKLDMGAEANILPVRTYRKMFPDRCLNNSSPDPAFLQPTVLKLECNKDSIIRSPQCITLQISLPGKQLIDSQFFLSEQHEQILIGHPACD